MRSMTDSLPSGGIDTYECGRCGAAFGIAGQSSGSDDDFAAEEFYASEVEYHVSGQCPPLDRPSTMRKDGKARRAPRLGLPSSGHNGLVQPADQQRQSWHELVQPGPKGDPDKALARVEAEAAKRTPKMLLENPMVMPRAMRRKRKGRGYNPGRLIVHRTRLSAVGDERHRPRVQAKLVRLLKNQADQR